MKNSLPNCALFQSRNERIANATAKMLYDIFSIRRKPEITNFGTGAAWQPGHGALGRRISASISVASRSERIEAMQAGSQLSEVRRMARVTLNRFRIAVGFRELGLP